MNSIQNHSTAESKYLILTLKIISSLIFPAYCIVINSNIQYSQDDFTLMQTVKELGNSWNATIWFYFNYEGSFLMFLREYSFFYFPKYIFIVLTLILNLLSLWFFIHSLFLYFKTKISLIDSWVIASIFSGGLYLLSMEASAIYHWLAGSTYLCSLTYTFWACGFMLRNKPFLALPFFVFVMQSRINFSFLVFSGYFVLFAYNYFVNKVWNKRMFYSLIVMLVAVIIYLIAPGNWTRSATHDQTSNESIFEVMRIVFIKEYLLHLPHALVFAGFIALVTPEEFIRKIKLKGIKITIPFLAIIALGIANMIIMNAATNVYYYASRVWLFNTVAYLFAICYYAIIVLHWVKSKIAAKEFNRLATLVNICLMLVISGVFINLGKTNYLLGKNYSNEFEKLIKNVQNAKGLDKSDVLWVPYLPNSGVLRYHKMLPLPNPIPKNYPFEIEIIQKSFSKFYGVPFRVLMTNDTLLINESKKHY